MHTLEKHKLVRREQLALLAIVALAVLLRVAVIWLNQPEGLGGDEPMFMNIARGIAEGRGFSFRDHRLPCNWQPGMPTAARAPGAPYWLAAWLWLFGENLLLPKLTVAVLSGLCTLLLFRIAVVIHSKVAGFFCAILWALGISEVFSWYGVNTIIGEPLALVLVIIALYALVTSLARGSLGWAIATGTSLALATLLRPTCLTLLPPVVLWALAFRRDRLTLRLLAIAFAAQIVVMAPWTIRNYLSFHAFIPVATYSGTNLYIANNPLCTANRGAVNEGDPPLEPEVVERMKTLPEVQASGLAAERATEYLRTNPQVLPYLIKRRMLLLWDPSISLLRPFSGTMRLDGWYLLTLFAALAALVLGRKNPMIWLLVLWSANFVWPHLLFQAHPRYRQMLDPTLMLLAASALATFWARGRIARAMIVATGIGALSLSLFSTEWISLLKTLL